MKRAYSLLLAIILLSSCSPNTSSSNESISSSSDDDISSDTSGSNDDTSSSEENGPISITSAAGLLAMTDDLNGEYELNNDITLTEEWMPIGSFYQPFTGVFNGNGFTISGLVFDPLDIIFDTEEIIDGETTTYEAKSFVGLFGINTGTISNVILDDITISGTFADYIGALSVDSSKIYLGPLVGYNSGTIQNIKTTGSVDVDVEFASVKAGGILGKDANGAISNVFSSVSLDVASQNDKAIAGGIVGETEGADGVYALLKATGDVIASMDGENTIEEQAYAGGIVGLLKGGLLENSFSSGNISAFINGIKPAYAGGIVGAYDTSDFDIEVGYVYASGNILVTSTTATKVYAGGILGRYEDKETGHIATLTNALSSSAVAGSTLPVPTFILARLSVCLMLTKMVQLLLLAITRDQLRCWPVKQTRLASMAQQVT